MDVDATLVKLLALAAEQRAWEESGEDPDEPGEYYRIASEMTQAFLDLHGALSRGAFLPKPWAYWQRAVTVPLSLEQLEKRTARLRAALLEAGVPKNLVRAVELGGEEPRAEVRTDEERRDGAGK